MQIVRVSNLYHFTLNGVKYVGKSAKEASHILHYAGYDPEVVLPAAIVVRDPYDIEYRPLGRHRWWLDGRPVPVKLLRFLLAETGCSKSVIDAILQAHTLCWAVAETTRRIREVRAEIENENEVRAYCSAFLHRALAQKT